MIIADVGHLQRKIAGIRGGCGHELELPQATDFAVDSWTAFAAGAVCGAVPG